jgi:hypothetical protein
MCTNGVESCNVRADCRWMALIAMLVPAAAHATNTDPSEAENQEQTSPPEDAPPEMVPPSDDIHDPLSDASAAGWILRPEPEPNGEEAAEEALDRYLMNALDTDAIAAGGADGWYYESLRTFRQLFTPDVRELLDERRSRMNPLQWLYDELRRYGQPPEQPIDVRGTPTLPQNSEQEAAQHRSEWCNPLNAPVTWYRVDLRLTQNPEGVLSAVWIVRSSGFQTVDNAALYAIREGVWVLPAPPNRITSGRDAIVSEWSFEFGDVATCIAQGVVGPDGAVSGATAGLMCVDDPVHGLQCTVDGRGITRTRITLLRVIDAQHPTVEERRHRARRNPTVLHP